MSRGTMNGCKVKNDVFGSNGNINVYFRTNITIDICRFTFMVILYNIQIVYFCTRIYIIN